MKYHYSDYTDIELNKLTKEDEKDLFDIVFKEFIDNQREWVNWVRRKPNEWIISPPYRLGFTLIRDDVDVLSVTISSQKIEGKYNGSIENQEKYDIVVIKCNEKDEILLRGNINLRKLRYSS